MDFSRRKLPLEAAQRLRRCPIETVSPYALMLAPVYVFLRRNEKFVSIKAPLDFFTTDELKQLSPYETFFLPECVDHAVLFREAAHRIRALFGWNPMVKDSSKESYPKVNLPPAPFELSDAVLRILGSLWSKEMAVEPFFTAILANELCDPISPLELEQARNLDIDRFEKALLRSGWTVFLALHLGYCDLAFLSDLRKNVFEQVMQNITLDGAATEVGELIWLSSQLLEDPWVAQIQGSLFNERTDRTSLKLVSRLQRLSQELVAKDQKLATIHGPEGFIDG